MKMKQRIRPIAILPTLFTLGNLCCGFFAIVVAARVVKPHDPDALYGDLDLSNCMVAACLIFLAMLFDVLDGHVARLSKSSSAFGAELDSLADLVSFGVAPAILLVKMCPYVTYWHREMVWIIAAMFVSCVALRLARFNVASEEEDDHTQFSGLPSPAAAAAIASFAFMFYALRWSQPEGTSLMYAVSAAAEWFLPLFAVLVAGLMVAPIPYPHLANRLFQSEGNFRTIVGLVFTIALVAVIRWYSVPILCAAYVLSGPANYLWHEVLHREEAGEEELRF